MNTMLLIRRERLKLTQKQMADACEVSQATVSRWESGKLLPSLDDLQSLRRFMDCRGAEWPDALLFQEAA